MVSRLSLPWRLVVSLVLGGMIWGVVVLAATKLPYSRILVNITDAASVPALVISQIFYPAGVHTGGGARRWGLVFLSSGIFFYGLMWFVILSWLNRRGRRSATTRSDSLRAR
jgi:hypothetical protein